MIIQNATIINEGQSYTGSLWIKDGMIVQIARDKELTIPGEEILDATDMYLMPGTIDDHVHMRDPGLTHKADMDTETSAAAAGGVTSVMDMPNVVPQTTTNALLEKQYAQAAKKCHVNYAFYLGATNDNLEEILHVDTHRVPGVKLFMGSSTGNMLVDKEEQLRKIFAQCPTLIMTHCEDTNRINECMKALLEQYGDDPDVCHHPEARDEEACYQSTALAVKMAKGTGARLHVAHLTTARELELFSPNSSTQQPQNITAEACVAHLVFSQEDYQTLGTRIKCNPAVKSATDREALRQALLDGRITLVGTDHAPHLLKEKKGGCRCAVSGMPMVQFSLPVMLTLSDEGILPMERVVELMSHAPARLFDIQQRGFIREGYQADLVLLSHTPWTITKDCVLSKCGWSPLEGRRLNWKVEKTWVNGKLVWDGNEVKKDILGQALRFNA